MGISSTSLCLDDGFLEESRKKKTIGKPNYLFLFHLKFFHKSTIQTQAYNFQDMLYRLIKAVDVQEFRVLNRSVSNGIGNGIGISNAISADIEQ